MVIRAFADRLATAGKPYKVIMVACMRKLLVILNAMVLAGTSWSLCFPNAKSLAAYVGLVPSVRQSADTNVLRRITKQGSPLAVAPERTTQTRQPTPNTARAGGKASADQINCRWLVVSGNDGQLTSPARVRA